MSMTILTILQIAQALSAYTLVTCIFPAILLHKRLAAYKMSERLIGYFLAGNFYIIYLVFLLQFLHTSYHIADWYDCSVFSNYLEEKKKFPYCLKSQFCLSACNSCSSQRSGR